MGTSLADALFSSTQRKVLALLFGQPERSYYTNEIIERVGAGSGAVQRELQKLREAGLVRTWQSGRQNYYQADPDSPLFEELRSIVRKTVGLAEPLREALQPLSDSLDLALIYGSVAKATDTAQSDIDVLIVSDALSLEEVFRRLALAEDTLGRPVHPTLYSRRELRRRLQNDTFLRRVVDDDVIVLFGDLKDVTDGVG